MIDFPLLCISFHSAGLVWSLQQLVPTKGLHNPRVNTAALCSACGMLLLRIRSAHWFHCISLSGSCCKVVSERKGQCLCQHPSNLIFWCLSYLTEWLRACGIETKPMVKNQQISRKQLQNDQKSSWGTLSFRQPLCWPTRPFRWLWSIQHIELWGASQVSGVGWGSRGCRSSWDASLHSTCLWSDRKEAWEPSIRPRSCVISFIQDSNRKVFLWEKNYKIQKSAAPSKLINVAILPIYAFIFPKRRTVQIK